MSEGGEAIDLSKISGVALFLNLLFLCVWEILITECLVNSLCSYEIELGLQLSESAFELQNLFSSERILKLLLLKSVEFGGPHSLSRQV